MQSTFLFSFEKIGTNRNKIKGLEQGFRNNKKIVRELGTKIKD